MIGPGEPNALNSGLGIAAEHIAKYLAQETELTVIQPEEIGQEDSKKDFIRKIKNLSTDKLNETNLVSDLTKINIRFKISPYFYPYLEFGVGGQEVDNTSQASNSDVKTALAEFTDLVVKESKTIEFDIIYAHDWTALPAGMEINHGFMIWRKNRLKTLMPSSV